MKKEATFLSFPFPPLEVSLICPPTFPRSKPRDPLDWGLKATALNP